jgi:hypothetical protein
MMRSGTTLGAKSTNIWVSHLKNRDIRLSQGYEKHPLR